MAIPTGPAGRQGARKPVDRTAGPHSAAAVREGDAVAPAPVREAEPARVEPRRTTGRIPRAIADEVVAAAHRDAEAATARIEAGLAARRENVRHTAQRESGHADSGQREPRESGHLDANGASSGAISPAVLGLSLADFFDLVWQQALTPADVTVDELFRMRDGRAFPDLFPHGDPKALFTEDMCRRGQFVPIGWHAEGLSFATCKDDATQDDLARALDMLVKMPVTLYTVTPEQVDTGIAWTFRKQ